jgi:hypothetical protein
MKPLSLLNNFFHSILHCRGNELEKSGAAKC